jgi:hypothetical protein
MVPAAIDQMVDAMEALDDDKLPAEDRIENAKENGPKRLEFSRPSPMARPVTALHEPPRWRSDVDTAH